MISKIHQYILALKRPCNPSTDVLLHAPWPSSPLLPFYSSVPATDDCHRRRYSSLVCSIRVFSKSSGTYVCAVSSGSPSRSHSTDREQLLLLFFYAQAPLLVPTANRSCFKIHYAHASNEASWIPPVLFKRKKKETSPPPFAHNLNSQSTNQHSIKRPNQQSQLAGLALCLMAGQPARPHNGSAGSSTSGQPGRQRPKDSPPTTLDPPISGIRLKKRFLQQSESRYFKVRNSLLQHLFSSFFFSVYCQDGG